MQVFNTIATILGLTALFVYGNARLLRLQQTIGLLVLALTFTALLMLLAAAGRGDALVLDRAFVTRLSLEVLNAVLFVLIGLHVALAPGGVGLLPLAAAAILVCLLARWSSVFVSLKVLCGLGKLRGDVTGLSNLLTWGGLRGGLAVAMALSLPDVPQKDVILQMTYGVAAFSIIVQGLSIERLFSASRLQHLLAPDGAGDQGVGRGGEGHP
jgi:hypothetical protein